MLKTKLNITKISKARKLTHVVDSQRYVVLLYLYKIPSKKKNWLQQETIKKYPIIGCQQKDRMQYVIKWIGFQCK